MTDIVRIGDATLIHADCRDVLPTLPKFDAVISDPPYGINIRTRVNFSKKQAWDKKRPDLTPFLAIARYHLFWGGQYFADKLPVNEGWLTWCKRPIDMGFSNDNRSYAATELAWRNWGKAKFFVQVWDGGMRAGHAENREFFHPSQKPIELMQWCIKQLPSDAKTVLDPFMGSGTTGVACAQSGRAFTGIERERKYFDIACERIERAYAQGKLFAEPAATPPQQIDIAEAA